MGAIDKLLRRWGYARLDRYGLVLTPEDRILATRPAVLDDGIGGRVVGWLASDLAASELEPWTPGQVGRRRELMPVTLGVPVVTRRAAVMPAVVPPPLPVAAPAPRPAVAPPVAAPVVAPAPVVEEDDWEWEIALARARAEAAEAAQPAQVVNPEAESWDSLTPATVRAPVEPAPVPPAQRLPQMLAAATTVIPVPRLPAVDPSRVRATMPAARPYTPAPRRFPKATGQLEGTRRTFAAPPAPANDDRTATDITPLGAGGRRVAAKHR